MFFSFDGIDGAGKSTQQDLFCEWLRERGHEVLTCRDPGSTPLGEAVREILLGDRYEIGRRAEMFLYMAARAQMVEQVIEPALAAGKTVVCDRFLLANVVYQGHAGGLSPEAIWRIGETAVDGTRPTLTFVLDMSVEAALARMNRQLDRMERQSIDFREALRAGFLAEAARRPDQIMVVDADRPVEAIQQEIRAAAAQAMGGS